MEIFELLKSYLATLGYSQFQSTLSHSFFNGKLLVATLAASLNMILCCLYFFIVADSFEEHIDSFFFASGSVGILGIFSIFVWKIEKIYRSIGQIRKTVNASKCEL